MGIKSIRQQKYITLSGKLEEIGKMLGGWVKGIQRNSSNKSGRTKQIVKGKEPIVIVPSVVVPVEIQVALTGIAPEFGHVAIAVAVLPDKMYKYHLCHHPSNTFGIESNLGY